MSHSQQNLQRNEKVWTTHRKKKRLTELIPKEAQHTKNKDFNSLKYALWKKPLIKKKKKLRKLGKYMKEEGISVKRNYKKETNGKVQQQKLKASEEFE